MKTECNEYQNVISAYMDGEADENEIRSMFVHLGECRRCRAFWGVCVKMEQGAAREKGIAASASLDARIALVGQLDQSRRLASKQRMPSRPAISTGSYASKMRSRMAVLKSGFSISYPVAAMALLIMMAIGFGAGMVQQTPSQIIENVQREVVYVSAYPNVTVVGHRTN